MGDMKHKTPYLCLLICSAALAGCGGGSIIPGGSSASGASGYEDYFINEKKYSKATDIADVNAALAEKAYFWEKSGSESLPIYYLGHGGYVVYNVDRKTYTFNFPGNPEADELRVVEAERTNSIAEIRINGKYLYLDKDGKYRTITGQEDTTGYFTDEEKAMLRMEKYEGGYLFFAYGKHLAYVPTDLGGDFYVNESGTNVFQGYQKTVEVPESELLTEALAKVGKKKTIKLPAPSKGAYEIWHGIEANSYSGAAWGHYELDIAGIEPQDYAKTLSENGFTVVRAAEDLLFNLFYGERGGYWVAYDEDEDLVVYLNCQDYLYAKGTTYYGPSRNTVAWIDRKLLNREIKGNVVTKNEDWTASEKEAMASWYNGNLNVTVPFVKLGPSYSVPKKKNRASEDLFGGALMLQHKCYTICDNDIHYHLDGYDKVLEAAGYKKFVPAQDVTTAEGKKAFEETEESKYWNCYINDSLDCAIKYCFSRTYGNVIRVFKKSEMKSHLWDDKGYVEPD